MTGKEFKEEKAKIEELRTSQQLELADSLTLRLIRQLFQEYKYGRILDLYHSGVCDPKESFCMFEVAYSLSEAGEIDEAEQMYENLLEAEAENTAILNNLSHIKRAKHQIHKAFELMQQAYQLVPHDQVIADNYHQLATLIQQEQALLNYYQQALDMLAYEDEVITDLLRRFVANFSASPNCHHYRMPIPEWEFALFMEIDRQQATALCNEWLEKGYLRDTGQRDRHLVPIYELNPFLAEELKKILPRRLPPEWVEGYQRLTVEALEQAGYFDTLQNIRKMGPKHFAIAERDLNELFLNYLMHNEKAVVVLAGSLLEIILIDYCERNDITKLYVPRKNAKFEKRDLYESDLSEILGYLREKKILGDMIVHIGNISRIYRNYIHPGKELREEAMLSQSESNLCFMSVMEVIKKLSE